MAEGRRDYFESWATSILCDRSKTPEQLRTFIAVFRKFIKPDILLGLWIEYLNGIEDSDEEGCQRAMHFLIMWLSESFQEDFNREERKAMIDMIDRLPSHHNEIKLLYIRVECKKRKMRLSQSYATQPTTLSSSLSRSSSGSNATGFSSSNFQPNNPSPSSTPQMPTLMSIAAKKKLKSSSALSVNPTPQEMAEALTWRVSNSFRALRARDLLTKLNWDKSRSRHQPNSVEDISSWVTSTIVSTERSIVKDQISYMIRLSRQCEILGNFDTCLAVLSGVNSFAVQRLKHAWAEIADRDLEDYDHLEDLMSPTGNFKVYHDELATRKGPIVPYIGLILRDFTFLGENEALTNGSINFELIKMIEQRLTTVWLQQRETYDISPSQVTPALSWFKEKSGIVIMDDEALYRRSLECEPAMWSAVPDSFYGTESRSARSSTVDGVAPTLERTPSRIPSRDQLTVKGASNDKLSAGRKALGPLMRRVEEVALNFYNSHTQIQTRRGVIRMGGQRVYLCRTAGLKDMHKRSILPVLRTELDLDIKLSGESYLYKSMYELGRGDARHFKPSINLTRQEFLPSGIIFCTYL
ncbi:Ras guanine nucleotide exchange factor, partial [Planoprotostelium fungivorum]